MRPLNVRAEVLLDEDHARHVRDYAAKQNDPAMRGQTQGSDPITAAQAGMDEMSAKFKAMGGQVYVDAEKAGAGVAAAAVRAPGTDGQSSKAVRKSNRALG